MYINIFTCTEYLTVIHVTENKDCIFITYVTYVKMAQKNTVIRPKQGYKMKNQCEKYLYVKSKSLVYDK